MSYNQDWEDTMGDPKAATAAELNMENIMPDVASDMPKALDGTDLLKPFDGVNSSPSVGGNFTKVDSGNSIFGTASAGNVIQSIGAVAQAAAGFYDAHNRKNYQDKVFKMEEERVNRETAKQDKQQAAYEKVFG